jgi:hypothetical protein
MKTLIVLLFAMTSLAWSKDAQIDVEVKATHSVTHEDQSSRAMVDKGVLGAHAPTRQIESFNLDTVINGDHVLLVCDDPKGCESPALGTYKGEMKRNKWIKLTFSLSLSHKEVSRWYKIAGSW